MSPEILFFFDKHLPALPLYEAFDAYGKVWVAYHRRLNAGKGK